MNKANNSPKGIILFIVIATIMIVVILSGIVLGIMSSQARLTRHQVSRIQAYYAAMAGMNLAYENLRSGAWAVPPVGGAYNWKICKASGAGCYLVDDQFPSAISDIVITVTRAGDPGCATAPSGSNACITSKVDYTYTP